MADSIKFESVAVSLSTGEDSVSAKPAPDTPFRILIIGDFSGRTNCGRETGGADIESRQLFAVDRDNDEMVMEKLGVALRLPVAGDLSPEVVLKFKELDDFHPEQIFFRAELFAKLRETRGKLFDPDTFEETAARLRGRPPSVADRLDKTAPARSAPSMPDVSRETPSGLLEQILDEAQADAGGDDGRKPASDWDRFLGGIVAPYLAADISQERDALAAGIDASIAALMDNILHHPDFQALEAAWRAVRFVVRRLEIGERLQLCLLDASKGELTSDLTGNDDIRDTALYKKLAAASLHSTGMAPWAVLAGMYTFGKTKADAIVLARLGAMGQMLGAPFVGGADGSLVGCRVIAETPDPSEWNSSAAPEDEKAWQVVRTLPEAAWTGLALPRFLIRLPYGEDTDPVEAFEFEEMPGLPNHGHYLWANPVFACVLALGGTFTRNGWDFAAGLANEVNELPLHLYKQAGETVIKPCAEVLLSDRALGAFIDSGIMALLSFKDQDRIRLARLQSVATPPATLSARWS